MATISVILPVHNQARILKKNTQAIMKYLEGKKLKYEIIIVEHGSSDKTLQAALKLAGPNVHVLTTPVHDIGMAIYMGLDTVKKDFVLVMGVDIPFGLEVIGRQVEALLDSKVHIVVASKRHAESQVNRPTERSALATVYNTAVNTLFGIGVSDLQGIAMIKRRALKKIIHALDPKSSFIKTQLLIEAKKVNLKIVEIPVTGSLKEESRKSVAKEAVHMVEGLIKELVRDGKR